MHLNFRADDEDVAIEVQPDGCDWRLKIDGQEVPLEAVPDRNGAWLVETHQGRRRLWVAVRGDERLIFCDGKVHTLLLPDPEHADEAEQTQGGPNMVADMPGKVVQVQVAVGQAVAAGEVMLILESMKMETELVAAVAGTVETIHVQDGQIVSQGDALVDLSESPAATA